jgi:hypothetical protein
MNIKSTLLIIAGALLLSCSDKVVEVESIPEISYGELMLTVPYLQAPSPQSMTAMWITSRECRGSVEYGTDSSLVASGRGAKLYGYTDGIPVAKTKIHKVVVDQLQPGTKYYYRVGVEQIVKYESYSKTFGTVKYTDVFSFITFNDSRTDFSMLVCNDWHRNQGEAQMTEMEPLIAGMKFDLVVFNGDCLDDLENEADLITWLDKYAKFARSSHVPLIYLRGNHETRGAMAHLLKDYVEYVKNGTSYGALNLGDTRLLFLDPGEDKPDNHVDYQGMANYQAYREEQTRYLDVELNSPEFKNAARRIAIYHIPTFSSVLYDKNYYNPCLALWGAKLNAAGIDLGMHGHSHTYEYVPTGQFKGSPKNNFPLYVGGGPENNAETIAILTKAGATLRLRVLDVDGNVKLDQTY